MPRGPDAGAAAQADARPPVGHGGMTPAGKLYTLVRQKPLNGLHSIEFLVHVLRVAAGRLLVIWDGSPIHRRGEVKEFGPTRAASLARATAGIRPGFESLG